MAVIPSSADSAVDSVHPLVRKAAAWCWRLLVIGALLAVPLLAFLNSATERLLTEEQLDDTSVAAHPELEGGP